LYCQWCRSWLKLLFYSSSPRGKVWAHKASLTPLLFIEVSVPSQISQRSCICVLEVSILPLSTILIFDFGIVPTVWYLLVSFYHIGVFGWYKFSGYYLCFGITQCVKREKKRQNINFPILRALCRYRMGMSSAIFHLPMISVDITANCEFYFCPCWRVLDAIVRNKRIFIDNLFLFLTPNWQHWGHKIQDGDK
jgi:hypothetical protein